MNTGASKGRFIAFEGGEGAGKSTQARMLAEAIAHHGFEVDVTREPGGTPGAEAIRSLLLDPPGDGWGSESEALLFAAARADHVARRIKPAIEQGRWIICDRFVDSSRAYQGGAGELGDEAIQELHQFGSHGLRPDLTILLEVNEKAVAQRLAERDGETSDAIGGRSESYHRKVATAFRRMAETGLCDIITVDGSGTPEAVHKRVLDAVSPLLESGAE